MSLYKKLGAKLELFIIWLSDRLSGDIRHEKVNG
jgi:hypothetical protein